MYINKLIHVKGLDSFKADDLKNYSYVILFNLKYLEQKMSKGGVFYIEKQMHTHNDAIFFKIDCNVNYDIEFFDYLRDYEAKYFDKENLKKPYFLLIKIKEILIDRPRELKYELFQIDDIEEKMIKIKDSAQVDNLVMRAFDKIKDIIGRQQFKRIPDKYGTIVKKLFSIIEKVLAIKSL